MSCLIGANGKQTKKSQSTKHTGVNDLIDRIEGVICRDQKGLTTLTDHKFNYCCVFLAKTEDVVAQKFKLFLVVFEGRFDCRVHALCTDCGGEYNTLDLFFKETGVAHQVSEARSQASNGKAECMHTPVLDMARCMICACRLPLSFWGDAVEYAAYVLNKSPTRANAKRESPVEILTGEAPDLQKIVTFSPTTPSTVNHEALAAAACAAWPHRRHD